MLLNFGEYAPDQDDLNGTMVSDVSNVLPSAGSYIPFPALATYSSAIGATVLSAFSVVDTSGTLHIFAGTATKLYKANSTSWTDVSKAATTYAATVDTPWSFTRFGAYVIAVNPNDSVQVYQLGTSTTFDNLTGSPPASAVARVWGDYLVLIQSTSDVTSLAWCDTNDITNWTTGVSGSQVFPDGGKLMGASESTNPIIFLENSIYLGTFVPGSTVTFTFQKIHDRRGAISTTAIASRGQYTFFADKGGFFQITPDGQLSPIGFERVDRSVFQAIAYSDAQNIRCTIDPFYTRVYWSVNLSNSGDYDTLYIYDWELGRWSKVNIVHRVIFPAYTPGYTLDGLDALGYTMETLPYSLDNKFWQSGAPLLVAFDTSNILGFFSGDNMEATITTQEAGDTGGAVTLVKSILPLVDTSSVYVSVGSRLRRSDTFTYTTESIPSTNTGIVRKKSRGRFHRVKVRIPAATSWTHAKGVDVDAQPSGKR